MHLKSTLLDVKELFAVLAIVFLPCKINSAAAQTYKRVQLGFPDSWDGDKYQELYCPSKNIPKFLDGYFLCQLSASYGHPKAPPGQRLNHMIDAIGAVGSFHISNGQVVFSAQYYPARPYKIWEFYDRNMTKASVPWAGWSDYNLTAMQRWEQVPLNPDSARFHPNLDFWRVGHKLIAGTEAPYWVGYQFDVRTLSQFKLFPFVEDNDIFGSPNSPLVPISMAIHERMDADGTLWGSFSVMNFNEQHFYQGIFTVEPSSVRRVVALYDYGAWDATACSKRDEYTGDKMALPGYLHSITSTENFIILPITSLLINPCKFKEPPLSSPTSAIQNGGLWGMDFYDTVPMRFLIFDKRSRSWATQRPLEVFPAMFITHQLNAFEATDGSLVADMVVYDSHDPYVKYFYTDFLTTQLYPPVARVLRFALDIREHRVTYSYLIPQETIAGDFTQINHAFDGRPYQWAYLVEHPFAADNAILKINVDDPAGARNLRFKTDPALVLHEPWFVMRPDAVREDDGVLLVRALDLEESKSVLLVLDAASMVELGRAYVPIYIPFGFHNRYFSKRELGLPDGGLELVGAGSARPTKDRSSSSAAAPVKLRAGSAHPLRRVENGGMKDSRSGNSGEASAYRRDKAHRWRPLVVDPPRVALGGRYEGQGSLRHIGERRPAPKVKPRPSIWQRVLTTQAPAHTPTWVPVYPDYATSPAPLSVHNSYQLGRRSESSPLNSRPAYPFLPHIPSPVGHTAEGAYGSASHRLLGTDGNVEKIVEGGNKHGLEETTVRELYERGLRLLCRWLPQIVRKVTFEGCMKGGRKAAKWVSPLAKTYAENLQSSADSRQQAAYSTSHGENLGEDEAPLMRRQMHLVGTYSSSGRPTPFVEGEEEYSPSNILRPVLKPRVPSPWYNYRTFIRPNNNRQ